MRRRLWTEFEESQLIKWYPNHSTQAVAALLQRSVSSVYGHADKVGLKKSPEYMDGVLKNEGMRLKVFGAKHQFPKGHTPANKGVKMSPETKDKLRHTFFKPEHQPHNTKYNGYERISKDGYVEVRIRKGKFIGKHRLIWQKHRGRIPNGMAVIFKDRNPMNIKLSNLKLVTRKELMAMNTIQRYPKALKSTICTLAKLKRIINEK